MPTKDEAEMYLNYMAEFLSIIEKEDLPPQQISAIFNFVKIKKATDKNLLKAWDRGLETFFLFLSQKVELIKQSEKNVKLVEAFAICCWMDLKLCYEKEPSSTRFSLYCLFPLPGDSPECKEALNTNYKETGIQLHPKFEVNKVYDKRKERLMPRPMANRDAFQGINGKLQNIISVPLNSKFVVQDIILPYGKREQEDSETFRVAFCPMSSEPNLLITASKQMRRNGHLFSGQSVQAITHQEELKERFRRDFFAACDLQADILFFPELLGLDEFEIANRKYSTWMRDLSINAMKRGKSPPLLTVMPSSWKNGINRAALVYRDGKILGHQRKYHPYVNEKSNYMEALHKSSKREVLLIHIPGVHRIAILLCAEFLDYSRDNLRQKVCEELGATLIIVPSFSPGEQDFVNMLGSLKCYGTTVIWGDCCGATQYPRIIGGCGIAGTDYVERFGNYCMCKGVCQKEKACVFSVMLPLRLVREKPGSTYLGNIIKHCINPLDTA